MPVIFDEVAAEIRPERTDPAPPAAASDAPNPTALADSVRREIALMEARRARLTAD